MAMVINSNIQSLNAQRHLNNSLDAQNTATERLSSGLRINSAKDDAAGLAIANRMTSQVQGLNQAVRNANDGAALIQTAEGGLEEMTNIMQRMRELSVQSANGTYSSGNRTTLNAEVDQLKQEIDRIAETTSFNGQEILSGKLGEISLQVGDQANQTIAIDIAGLSSNKLGGNGGDLIGAATAATLLTNLITTSGGLTINGDVTTIFNATINVSNQEEAVNALNASVAGVEISSFVEIEADLAAGGTGALSGIDSLTITVAGHDAAGQNNIFDISDTKDLTDLVDKINAAGGDKLSASLNDAGRLTLFSDKAASITIGGNGVGFTKAGFTNGTVQNAQLKFEITDSAIENIDIQAGTLAAGLGLNDSTDGTIRGATAATVTQLAADQLFINDVEVGASSAAGVAALVIAINRVSSETGVVAGGVNSVTLTSSEGKSISIESGASVTGATDQIRDVALAAATGLHVTNEATSTSSTVASINISTAEGAQRSIGILDDAIEQVSETRGDLGAISNRLDYTTRNLSNISENAASARSSIMDADFAAESANLSRAQVLQQAGNAMLAQANSRPQQVLSLLQ